VFFSSSPELSYTSFAEKMQKVTYPSENEYT